jgi:hypothetical protein
MSMNPRKVVELLPRVHQELSDVAHERGAKMNQLGSILMAYALEHLDDAIAEADHLLAEYEGPVTPRPGILRR